MKSLGTFLSILAVAAAAGCTGTSDPRDPTDRPIVCSEPELPTVQQLYPVPGATGVAASGGVLIVAEQQAAAGSTVYQLQSGSTPLTTQPGTLPSPLPSPIATISPILPNPVRVAFAIPKLASNTTYSVAEYLTNFTTPAPGAVCPPPSAQIGTLTTGT